MFVCYDKNHILIKKPVVKFFFFGETIKNNFSFGATFKFFSSYSYYFLNI
jgi:hypothetical protein